MTILPVAPTSPAEVNPATWEPGIPLYASSAHPHSQFIYNFREEPEAEDYCGCGDSADWPGQKNRRIPDGDEIGDLIAAVRADRAAEASA